ncbi:MAG: nucleotidyltransferase domain-containing protein [Candidatus Woesearchaeota archaeon]
MKLIYIKKEVSLKKVSAKYKLIVKNVRSQLLKHSDKIHSIYLYGSVATGKAKSPSSDLDMIIVLNRKPTLKTKSKLKDLENLLSQKYQKTFREVGFAITYKNEVLRGKDAFGWRFTLEILSVRIYGKNLFQKRVRFSPTKRLAKGLHSDVYENIREAKKKLNSANTKEYNIQIKSIMKKLIRTAFSIVMEDENYWTTNLDEMTKIFIKHYPTKKQQINAVLEMTKTESPNKNDAIFILNTFGKWVSSEYFKRVN